MPKGNVNIYLCEDGVLIHDKNSGRIYTWHNSLDFIKIIKSKRKVEDVMNSL